MNRDLSENPLLNEYYEIFRAVTEFDKRLMTVKGWGVTLSLATLAWGFQFAHYGLFLVAALSGVGFWLIEGAMKRHQMRHYLRMREIEVLQYERSENAETQKASSPRIDSSWSNAAAVYLHFKKDYSTSLKYFTNAARLDYKKRQSLEGAAESLVKLKKYKEAYQIYKSLAKIGYLTPALCNNTANILLMHKQYKPALKFFKLPRPHWSKNT